jgi:hypothetical protein
MAKTQPAVALKAALRAARQKVDTDDRALILQWITQVDDQAFEDLVTDLIAHGEIGDDLYVTCATVIWLALRSRHAATDLKHGVDGMSRRMQGQIAELRQLAQKADDLARFCRGSGKRDLASLTSPQVGLGPLIKQHGLMPLQDLAELHEREARSLRQFAAKEAEKDRTRTSRYRISRMKRSRERTAFMRLMAADLRELCGRPHYDAIAVITNIAFPAADVTSEHVRAACRPTTRQSRRSKTGALGPKKRT